MKLCYLLLLGTILSVSPVAAQNLASLTTSSYDGKVYDFSVTDQQIQNMPDWSVPLDNPPLSPRKAIALARQDLTVLLSDSSKWTLKSVSLCPTKLPNKWVYEVEFGNPPVYNVSGVMELVYNTPMCVVVLMDGTAIKPAVKPDPRLVPKVR